MQIKKKSDIGLVLERFSSFANWDAEGNKHYLVFEDRKRGGQWTLMKYESTDRFSVHGLGDDYNDDEEAFFEVHDNIVNFLWEHRSVYNASVKKIALSAF